MIGRLSGQTVTSSVRLYAFKAWRLLIALIGIVVVSALLSSIVVKADVYFVVLMGTLIVACIVLAYRFEAGMFLFFLIAPFKLGHSPDVLGGTTNVGTGIMPGQVALVFLIAFWTAAHMLTNELTLVKTRLNAPIAVFLGVAVASAIAAPFFWDPDVTRYDKQLLYHISEIGLWALCAAAFFLTANSIKNKAWLKSLYWPIVLLGVYVSLCHLTGLIPPFGISRATFLNAFAAIATTARILFGQDKAPAKIGFLLLLGFLMLGSFMGRTWVSGWLTASLGVGIILMLYSRWLFILAAIVVIAMILLVPGMLHSVYDESRQEGDLDRLDMWTDAARMAVSVNPLLGIGPADYLTYARKYGSIWYGHTTYTTAHSDYAQIIAELGLLGILAFIWLVVAGIRTGIDTIRRCSPDIRWFAIAGTVVFASIAVTSLVGDYLLPSRVNGGMWSFGTSVYPWIMLGAAVAAARISDDSSQMEDGD